MRLALATVPQRVQNFSFAMLGLLLLDQQDGIDGPESSVVFPEALFQTSASHFLIATFLR